MKTSKRKTIPKAPAKVSLEIYKLAHIRAQMAVLAAESKICSKAIIKFGSCHNDKWRAYVQHHNATFSRYQRKARDCVVLKPMKDTVK